MKRNSVHKIDKKQALSYSLTNINEANIILPHQSELAASYETFLTQIVNTNTYRSYANGINFFFSRVHQSGMPELVDIEPKHISAFLSWMNEQGYGVSTTRLYLSALRMFLDHCVIDGLISVNPAKAVKLPKHSSRVGKTPVIVPEQVRQILDAIPRETQACPAPILCTSLI